MSAVKTAPCPFCKQTARFWIPDTGATQYGYDCPICNQFFISAKLTEHLKNIPQVDRQLLNCIAENISTNSKSGDEVITQWNLIGDHEKPIKASNTFSKNFQDYSKLPIIHAHKCDQLLMIIAEKASKVAPFSQVKVTWKDLYKLKILDISELFAWHDQLEDQKLLNPIIIPSGKGIEDISYVILPKGWDQIYRKSLSLNSKQVFLAMKFNWNKEELLRKSYVSSVREACLDCGYSLVIIDKKDHLNPILDQIITDIKYSRFVIADFTHNNRGVYFEAGFARGYNIPVIHTVMDGHTHDKENDTKHLHFDIQQINYLKWKDPVDLKKKLINRIRATIEE